MLRIIAMFLALFLLLSLVVHLAEVARIFGMAAVIFFALDRALVNPAKDSRVIRMRGPVH
jgi:hypothetical protein